MYNNGQHATSTLTKDLPLNNAFTTYTVVTPETDGAVLTL